MHSTRALIAAALLASALVAAPRASDEAARAATPVRPNIVMVMMDDMRWDELRFAPNVQRHVTGRGLQFANSFSPLPLCCPARSSFLLGQYAHNHKVLTVSSPYAFGSLDDHRTVATSLQSSGYNTAMVGKYLNGYGRMPSRVTGGASMLYKPAGWTDWMASVETKWPRGSKYSGGTYDYLSFTQNVNRRLVMNRGRYSSDVIGAQARALVTKYHASSKPFFLWLNPVAPHHGGPTEKRDPRDYRKANGVVQKFRTPYTPKWVRGRFDRSVTHAPGVPLRRPAEPDLSDKPAMFKRMLENTPTEKARLREVQQQRAESIYAWDAQFGKLVNRLRQTGEYSNTVFMFTSDNGYFLGEHRQPTGKVLHHEVSSRVPLVVAGPGVQRGVRYSPAMTHDLTPTILDIGNAASLPQTDGTTLWPQITGPDRPWTRPVLLEALFKMRRDSPGFPADLSQFAVRTGRYKYVRYSSGEEELYDLATDPNELEGRQRDPAYAGVKAALVAQWNRYLNCRGASCTAPLPAELQVPVPALRSQAANATRAWNAHYN